MSHEMVTASIAGHLYDAASMCGTGFLLSLVFTAYVFYTGRRPRWMGYCFLSAAAGMGLLSVSMRCMYLTAGLRNRDRPVLGIAECFLAGAALLFAAIVLLVVRSAEERQSDGAGFLDHSGGPTALYNRFGEGINTRWGLMIQ